MDFDEYIWKDLPDGALPEKKTRRQSPNANSGSLIVSSIIAKALVVRLLIPNPLHRATVYSALQSKWISDDFEALGRAYQDRITLA